MAVAAPVTLPAPFAWRGDHVAVELGSGATALFTTRRGGVSTGPFASLNLGRWTDDDPGDVERNRDLLAAAVAIGRDHVLQGRQVHGTRVLRVDGPARVDGAPPEADGVATTQPWLAGLVLTADCMPVALAAPGAVAMLHAGWRGLADGVLEEGVRAVGEIGGDGPMAAAIGPAAGGCCYEVGDDVREALGQEPLGRPAPIDLKAEARARLVAAGVTQVHDAGLCTMCAGVGGDPLFFSHRRDRGRTGRQAGVVWRS